MTGDQINIVLTHESALQTAGKQGVSEVKGWKRASVWRVSYKEDEEGEGRKRVPVSNSGPEKESGFLAIISLLRLRQRTRKFTPF